MNNIKSYVVPCRFTKTKLRTLKSLELEFLRVSQTDQALEDLVNLVIGQIAPDIERGTENEFRRSRQVVCVSEASGD